MANYNKKTNDYVISTGKQYSVKQFVDFVAKKLKMKIIWFGKEIKEVGKWQNRTIIVCNKKYLRPSEVDSLLGNSAKARKELKWKPKISMDKLSKK